MAVGSRNTNTTNPCRLKLITVRENVQSLLEKDTCVRINKTIEITIGVFKGIGCLKGYVYDIDLVDKPNLPMCPARRVPHTFTK